MSKFDPMLSGIKTNLSDVEGELYNFSNQGKKKSASVARKALLNIQKICKVLRQEIQAQKSALPVRRRAKKAAPVATPSAQ